MTSKKKKLSYKIWGLIPWLFVLCLISLIFILGKAISEKSKNLEDAKSGVARLEEASVNVVAQKIRPSEMTNKLDLPAVFKAWKEITIKAEVGGLITDIKVNEGENIAKGQVIALIDQRDYLNSIASIESNYKLAELSYNRISKLSVKAAVSKAELDKAEAEFDVLKASLSQARLLLERCTIKAPMAGKVNDLPIEIGTLIKAGDPIAHMLNIDRLELEVAVPESDVSEIRNLQKAKITIAALQGRQVFGEKVIMASKPVEPAMVYPLTLAVANEKHEILPGMFAKAELVKEVDKKSYGIPLYAIITEKHEKYVYVVENNKAVKRKVEAGFLEDWKVKITSGLSQDELVVIVGHRGLEDGQPVKIVKQVVDPGEIRP